VLVVDDDPDILLYLDTLLGDHGFEVLTVASAPAASQALAAASVDLLILDVQLQGRSGLDLLLSLRNDPARRELPVVLLTGDDRVLEDRGRSYQPWQGNGRGADAVLGKPLDSGALLATLGRRLAR